MIDRPRVEIDCRGEFVYRLAVSPCGSRVVACDGGINLYDVSSNRYAGQLPKPDEAANCLMYSPDGKLIVAGGGGDESELMQHLRVYDAETLEKIASWKANESNVRMARFNPEGSLLVSCGVDARVRLWDTTDWSLVADIEGHSMNIQDVWFSRDGRKLISGGLDGKPRIWDVASRAAITEFDGHDGENGIRNYAVAIHPDGEIAVCGFGNNMIRAWDTETGEQVAEIAVGDATNYLSFTPSGNTLVAVLWGGAFCVIDTSSWTVVNRVAASDERTHGHAMTPDGKTLVLASLASGHKIQLWDMDDVGGVG
ncbi:MAG: WD40 repeat domain-containing protein [Verrucomicrobiales bacterium]